jgi:hypothetical protein
MPISETERKRLARLFRQAVYELLPGELQPSRYPLKIGDRHPELDAFLRAGESWIFITAYHPMGQPQNTTINQAAQRQLLEQLQERAKKVWRGRGYSSDPQQPWEEPTLLTLPFHRREALDLARQFQQLAILYGEKQQVATLLFTD